MGADARGCFELLGRSRADSERIFWSLQLARIDDVADGAAFHARIDSDAAAHPGPGDLAVPARGDPHVT